MTENNAAQPGLTDSAIQALWDEACKDGPQSPGWNRHIRFARALLSKLRAEGVQAGGLPAYINDDSQPLQYRLGWNNCLSDCRAALASAPVASEAVRDAVDVALPLLPKGHARNSDVHPDSYAYDKWQLADYARAAILAYRQRGADPVIGHITVKGKGRSSVDLDASHADLPEGEYVLRAALASAPVAGEAQEPVGEVFRHGEGRDENGPRVGIRMLPAAAGIPHGTQVYAAPQASEAVRNAALEEAVHALWLMRSRPEFEPDEKDKLLDRAMAAIRALKTQADKDGGDCAKGAGGLKRYVVLKASGSRYAYVNDTLEGRTVKRFDVINGDGWEHASLLAVRLNNAHFAALAAQKQGDSE